jgi:membrane protein YdbS with pleckstrin-like domain
MLCSVCGKKINSDDTFCPKCGTKITVAGTDPDSNVSQKSSFEHYADKNPTFSVQPVFNPTFVLMTIFPIQLFISIWGAFFFSGIFAPFSKTFDRGGPEPRIQILIGLILFITIPTVYYYITKKNYSKSWYRFYNDRLEFYEGFFIIQEKTIKYGNITELNLRRGFLQRHFKLGTIIISTPATGYSRGRAVSGIRIRDIAEPESVYNKVKEIVDKAESGKVKSLNF